MITILLLCIIYLAFISLGLPDSLLGVAWPAMQQHWQMPVDAIGIISMTLIGCTIISSFFSGHIIKRFGTGLTTVLSCALTGLSLLGIAHTSSFYWLLLMVIPLGLGGGSVDAALNNYVALHFKAHHMNWLHSFWGVGATIGPIIMAQGIHQFGSWHQGYQNIGYLQLTLMVLLFLTLPLWSKHKPITAVTDASSSMKTSTETPLENKSLRKVKGLPYALTTVLMYCSIEQGIGLWGSTFLVQVKQLNIEAAASWIGLYYGGITIGRFLSGFLTFRLSNVKLIRLGMMTTLIGSLIILSTSNDFLLLSGFMLTGIGLAPIYPSTLHETPKRFGRHNTQRLMGIQMGFAYIGSAFLSPLWGPILKNTSLNLFPLLIIISLGLLIYASEKVIHNTKEFAYD